MAKQQKFRFFVPKGLTPADRRQIGLDVIAFIEEQALINKRGFKHKTKRWVSFKSKPYEKDYAKKKGVGITDVDLHLKGDMFNAIEVLRERSGSITVGFQPGKQNDKAEGNQIGSYGQPTANPKKARPFLGISKIALDAIITKVKDDGSKGRSQ